MNNKTPSLITTAIAALIAGCQANHLSLKPTDAATAIYVAPQGTTAEMYLERESSGDDRKYELLDTSSNEASSLALKMPDIPFSTSGVFFGERQGPYFRLVIPAEEPVKLIFVTGIPAGTATNMCTSRHNLVPKKDEVYMAFLSQACGVMIVTYKKNPANGSYDIVKRH